MILIVSAQKPSLDGEIDKRFGRSPWLMKIDTVTFQWEAFRNPGVDQSGGAGVAAAQLVIDQKADAAVSGDFGPNAYEALKEANIEMRIFTDGISSVKQAVELFVQNKLTVF